jgi:hypothetical protein
MSPTPQPDETSLYAEWALKIVGTFAAFVGGIVSATWSVASRIRGFDDRLGAVEKAQTKCQVEVLGRIADKLESLPERIEAKIESRLDRIHDRIDDIIQGK